VSDFLNLGDLRGANLFQDSEVYNAPVFSGPVYLQSWPVSPPTAGELRAAAECFARLPLDELPSPGRAPNSVAALPAVVVRRHSRD
jgi:hypothetical protein